jgi:hypothetical protein
MIKEQIVYKIQSKMLKICEERFGTTKCNAACNECAFKKLTDYMIEELEDYY